MIKLKKIFNTQEKTPYFLINPKKANQQTQKIQEHFKTLNQTINYLLNANNKDWMIETHKKKPKNNTITTYQQTTILKNKRITTEKITLMNPTLTPTEIQKCYEIGITNYHIYSHNQLKILRTIKGNKKITLITKTEENSLGLTLKETNLTLGESSELDDITGLHYFFGTQSQHQRKNYEDLTKFIIFTTQIKKTGYNIQEITISPGIPTPQNNQTTPTIETISQEITKRTKELNKHNIKINLLIGRYIAAPTMKLITTITNIENQTAYIDASAYNTYADCLITKTKLTTENNKQGKKTKYTIRGCTPDKLDILTEIETTELKPQTQLTFTNLGAYQITTDFANLKKPKTVIKNE